jgi:hypothetical protein
MAAREVAVALTRATCLVDAGIRMTTRSDNGGIVPTWPILQFGGVGWLQLDSPAMFRKRLASRVRPELVRASRAFQGTLAWVEEAKRRLASAAPGGRSAGIPLAEALAGFEEGIRQAEGTMTAWRTPEVDEAWSACTAALEESLRRAEGLRLGETPEGYEQLYGTLGDLMDPLEAFAVALDRFRTLGA